MERLTQKQQAELTKMSNDRLRMKLARTGIDEEAIATAERTELLNMYAEYLLLPHGAVGGGTNKLSEEEFEEVEVGTERERNGKTRGKSYERVRTERERSRTKTKGVNITDLNETEGVRIART